MSTGSWHADPTGRHQYRFWDGTNWTEQVSDNGVVGHDPVLSGSTATPPHSAWLPPTISRPTTQVPTTASAPTAATALNKRRGAMIGVAALMAAGVATVVYVQRDDSSGNPAVTTPTTVAAVIDAAALVAAMPSDSEVPAEWVRYHEPHPETDTSGTGACSGPSDHARALMAGTVAIADGPRWDLPNNGWFGIDLYHFETEAAAAAFLAATVTQANQCATTPVTWQASEGDWGMAGDWMPDDTMWQMSGTATASERATAVADQQVQVTADQHGTVTFDGVLYGAALRYIDQWERHGLVVIDFWIGGDWGESGWTSFENAYQPTEADLAADVDAVRSGIIGRLASVGAL